MNMQTTNNIIGNFKKRFQTQENQEWMEKFLEELEEKEMQRRDLVQKYDYINWLEKFTKKHPEFCDDTWLYKQDEISKEDYENVCKISTFFSVISDFADKHYIPAYVCAGGTGLCYFVKYNGIIYEFGTIIGQGAVSYCDTLDSTKITSAVSNRFVINFEEIANPSDELCKRTDLIARELRRIDSVFKILVNNKKLNIPIEAIIARSDKVLKELKEKELKEKELKN